MVLLQLRTILLQLFELQLGLVGWGGGTVEEFQEGSCPAPLGEDYGEEKVEHILKGAGQQYQTNPSSLDQAQGSPSPKGKLEV